MRSTSIIAAVYLLACLTLGGSGQGIASNLYLQVAAVSILVWLTWRPTRSSHPGALVSLRVILVAGLCWSLLQLVPLPPELWVHLPGRSLIAQGFDLSGESLPWMPLSLTPDATIACLLSLLPALALGTLVVSRVEVRADWLATALLAATTAGIVLGIIQLGGGEGYYLYPVSNFGTASGFFANTNHMAALILVAIPFQAALAARYLSAKRTRSERIAGYAVFVLMTMVLLTGIATNEFICNPAARRSGHGRVRFLAYSSRKDAGRPNCLFDGGPCRFGRGCAAHYGSERPVGWQFIVGDYPQGNLGA